MLDVLINFVHADRLAIVVSCNMNYCILYTCPSIVDLLELDFILTLIKRHAIKLLETNWVVNLD